jgi:hypothetical protein
VGFRYLSLAFSTVASFENIVQPTGVMMRLKWQPTLMTTWGSG